MMIWNFLFRIDIHPRNSCLAGEDLCFRRTIERGFGLRNPKSCMIVYNFRLIMVRH